MADESDWGGRTMPTPAVVELRAERDAYKAALLLIATDSSAGNPVALARGVLTEFDGRTAEAAAKGWRLPEIRGAGVTE